jgi:hypothetical protein
MGEAAMTASLATRSDARCVLTHIDALSRQCPQSRPASWRPISRILRMLRSPPSTDDRPHANAASTAHRRSRRRLERHPKGTIGVGAHPLAYSRPRTQSEPPPEGERALGADL